NGYGISKSLQDYLFTNVLNFGHFYTLGPVGPIERFYLLLDHNNKWKRPGLLDVACVLRTAAFHPNLKTL
ncbi:hypothetical protein, partial [Aliiroseovarius crassostreae]|uniref:hypothetical protein n=1 Tax=Aliiroseovarius crassostreae TaxID=154981 RepID=UPI001C316890